MPERVIFACVHNAGRSQMAAAWFNRLADPLHARAESAGTQPGTSVHPVVIDVMNEAGIDLTSARPQQLTSELAHGAALLVTMGCGEECPFVPGVERDDWPLPDPKGRPIGEVRETRDAIRDRVAALVASRGWGRSNDGRRRAGLCADCTCAKRVPSANGPVYFLCERSATDPAYPKYPQLPVLRCAGYERRPTASR